MSARSVKEILTKLIQKQALSGEEAGYMMLQALEGNLSDAQTAAWLTASAAKSETSEEIFSYAEVMREKSKTVSLSAGETDTTDAMDTCGTGGDASNLMNISTLTGITLASLKIPVAKHGNRSVSSKSGFSRYLRGTGI